MEQALALDLPIIGVNLNGLRYQDSERCPPIIRDKLAIHISYNPAILQYALENWPNDSFYFKTAEKVWTLLLQAKSL